MGDETIAQRIPPDLWTLHGSLVTPRRKAIAVDLITGLKQNRAWFPQHRKYLADRQPATLTVWGPRDHYMPEESALRTRATCHRPSCICWTAAIGFSRPTWTKWWRSCAISWAGALIALRLDDVY